jgi:threonine dehydrogenase-like Zn-dependent dehydrogenase
MVQLGPRQFELREFPIPDIDDTSGLLRVEACGVCGTDVEQYTGAIPARFPLIPGHEPVGIIEQIGETAARRWGVGVGDRVAVENYIPCGHCTTCQDGKYPQCRSRGGNFGYGHIPLSEPPAIWGAFADYMYLHPNSIVHRISKDVPATVATLFNPLGAGFRWAVEVGDVRPGDTVLILGPGQRGIASAIAARAAGAGMIIVTGLARDAHKLAIAKQLGADVVINVEAEDTAERVRALTGGLGADVVLEVSAFATSPVADSLHFARVGGCIVLAGLKGFKPVPEFVSDIAVIKELTLRGVFAVTRHAYECAVRRIESDAGSLSSMHTHDFPLPETARAIETLAGEVPGVEAVHCCVVPSLG